MNLATLIRTRQARGATSSELTLLRSLEKDAERYAHLREYHSAAEKAMLKIWPLDWCWSADLAHAITHLFSHKDAEIARLTAQVEELLHERDAHTCPRCAHAHQLATQADDPNSTSKDTRAALDKLRAYCKGGK